jgi:hypothetical protein
VLQLSLYLTWHHFPVSPTFRVVVHGVSGSWFLPGLIACFLLQELSLVSLVSLNEPYLLLCRDLSCPQYSFTMPRRRYVSPPTDWFPPAQRTIVYTLQGLGLEIHPWIYMMGRDLHAWVTLNGLKPLTFVVPKLCNREAGRRQENGTLDWEWSINADYEDGSHPWRGYIPLHNDWVKWGTQGWLFERQIPTSVLITAGTPARLHICKARKKNIELTYRAIDFICLNVSRMYELDIPFRLHPPPVQWVNEEYPDQASICARIWDARRSILELYGWVSYQLLHDLSPWRERIWKPAFRDLLNRLDFLSASRRGVIIDPSSASEDQIIKLVRDEVPIHYQWIPRGYIVHDPVIYTALAARFDPYDFEITRDYAAYRQAGGPYSIQSMDHSKLNSNGTAELSAAYARGKNRLFQLPAPKEVSGNVKKKKMRCFAYDSDEGEYVEVSKAAMDRLVHFETGKVITKYHDSGDMMVFTFLEPPTPSLETSKLHNFFERLEPEEQVTESVFIQLQPAQPPHPAMGQEIGNAHAEVPSCPPDHDHDVPMEPVVQSPPAQSSQPVAELSFEAMVIDDRSLLDVDSPIDQGIGENVIITQLDGPPCPPGRDHDHPMDLIDPIVQSQPLQPAVRQMSHEVALIDQPRVDEQPRSPDQANEDPVELTLQPPSTQPPQPAVEQPFDTTNVVDQPLPVEPSRPSIQDYDSDSNSTISLGESTTMSWDNFVGEGIYSLSQLPVYTTDLE